MADGHEKVLKRLDNNGLSFNHRPAAPMQVR
jgi:hypothetical protein